MKDGHIQSTIPVGSKMYRHCFGVSYDVGNMVCMKIGLMSFFDVVPMLDNNLPISEQCQNTLLDRRQLSTLCRCCIMMLVRCRVLTAKQHRKHVGFGSWIDIGCRSTSRCVGFLFQYLFFKAM